MTRFTQILGAALLAGVISAEPQHMPEYESERQPGTLRISGVSDNDRVLLDGELIGSGKRLARFGSKLLVNPGEYTVTIVSASNGTCVSHVQIEENRTSVARCSNSQDQQVDD